MQNKKNPPPGLIVLGSLCLAALMSFIFMIFITNKINDTHFYQLATTGQITTPIDSTGEWYGGDADTLYVKEYIPDIPNIQYGPYWKVTTIQDAQAVMAIKTR